MANTLLYYTTLSGIEETPIVKKEVTMPNKKKKGLFAKDNDKKVEKKINDEEKVLKVETSPTTGEDKYTESTIAESKEELPIEKNKKSASSSKRSVKFSSEEIKESMREIVDEIEEIPPKSKREYVGRLRKRFIEFFLLLSKLIYTFFKEAALLTGRFFLEFSSFLISFIGGEILNVISTTKRKIEIRFYKGKRFTYRELIVLSLKRILESFFYFIFFRVPRFFVRVIQRFVHFLLWPVRYFLTRLRNSTILIGAVIMVFRVTATILRAILAVLPPTIAQQKEPIKVLGWLDNTKANLVEERKKKQIVTTVVRPKKD